MRSARIFNTYGPRMRADDGRVIPSFMVRALRHEPLVVHGDGSQTRSLCYVDDLAEGLYRLLTYQPRPSGIGPSPDGYQLIMNLGNPDEATVLELTESRSAIVFQPLPEDDPRVRRPDISRARSLLRWEPKVRRHDGLKLVLDYFKKALGL